MAIALNIPSQIEKYLSLSLFPATGNDFTLYIANNTNRLYQWDGAAYIEVSQQDAVNWGSIGGDIINQTDLQLALAAKVNTEAGKGLSTNDYTTAEKNKLAGIEAGAQVNDVDSVNGQTGAVVLTKSDVGLGNVDNTSDANKPISTATQTALNAKQNSLGYTPVPTSRTLTINGTTQDLSADRTFTISTGITIGTTAITSGTVGRVLFEGTGNVVQESANLFWDNTNGRLGIGTSSPISALDLFGNVGLGSASAVGLNAVSGRITFKNGANNTRIESVQVDASFPQNQRLDFYPHTSNASAFQVGFNGITSVLNHNFTANALLTASSSVTFAHTSGVSEGIRFDAITKRIRLNSYYISLEGNTSEVFQATDGTNVLMRLRGNGNLLINTITDAGFRLDVNGTARVQGNTNVIGNIAIGSGVGFLTLSGAPNNNVIQGNQSIEYRSVGTTAYRAYHNFTNNSSFTPTVDFIPHVIMGATFAPTSGTGSYAQLLLQPTINQTGGANGITRGLVIDPTLTAAADFRAIETTRGNVLLGTTSGNVLIGTSTNAGFKLDVNGTARVSGTFTNLNPVSMTLTSNYAAEIGFNTNGKLAIGYSVSSGSIMQAVFGASAVDLWIQPFGGSLMIGENVNPSASARVQINSTTKGFLKPRLTTTQKNAIASPAAGLEVYDTTLNRPCFYDGTTWITL